MSPTVPKLGLAVEQDNRLTRALDDVVYANAGYYNRTANNPSVVICYTSGFGFRVAPSHPSRSGFGSNNLNGQRYLSPLCR